MHVCATKQIA